MGWGDELIAAGQARLLRERDPRRVLVMDRFGRPRWHEAWEHNPDIARPGDAGAVRVLVNGPGERPYIKYKTPERWVWRAFDCRPGRLCFSDAETRWAAEHRPGIVIEPNLKPLASPNKDWSWARWTAFAELARARGIALTQLGPAGTRLLPGVRHIETPSMRLACAVLSRAQAYVGHEGGMHHAAAALGRPAVVLFGGYISPAQTGYAAHVNLFTGGTACGSRQPCTHCAQAMAAIGPAGVLTELETLIEANRRNLAA